MRAKRIRRTAGLLCGLLLMVSCGGANPPDDHLRPYFQTNFSGMMQDAEPDEGAIPAAGRTYRGSFKPWNKEALAGIQLLLGNLSANPIRGAKLLVGLSTNGNSEQLPTQNGVATDTVTGNPRTGWVRVTIGGAEDLPVRADADGSGMAWTDLVSFSPSLQPDEGEIVWRIWLPARATARYARTYSGGPGSVDDNYSAIASLAMLQREVLQTGSWMRFAFTDGDAVSDPDAADWVTTPNPDSTFDAYGRSYVSSLPILGYRWKATRSVPVIEFVGDSITQGYGDHDQTVNVDGMPGRVLRALGSGSNASYNIVNFGQSGAMPEDYLKRWKGLARADINGASAMVYSIFSPNGFADGVHVTQERIDAMKTNTLAAEQAATDLGRLFIPAFITGTNMNLLNPCQDGRRSWCQDNTGLVKDLLDWAKLRYGNRLLDLHGVIADKTTVGPAMQDGWTGTPSYTTDETHPNTLGYETLGANAVSLLPTAYRNARNTLPGP